MENAIVHFEIPATKLKKTLNFYSKLFGWKIDKMETSGCLLYIHVNDTEEKLKKPGGAQQSKTSSATP
jgi:predicted enzyme related to lactoylglutathione lyase